MNAPYDTTSGPLTPEALYEVVQRIYQAWLDAETALYAPVKSFSDEALAQVAMCLRQLGERNPKDRGGAVVESAILHAFRVERGLDRVCAELDAQPVCGTCKCQHFQGACPAVDAPMASVLDNGGGMFPLDAYVGDNPTMCNRCPTCGHEMHASGVGEY